MIYKVTPTSEAEADFVRLAKSGPFMAIRVYLITTFLPFYFFTFINVQSLLRGLSIEFASVQRVPGGVSSFCYCSSRILLHHSRC